MIILDHSNTLKYVWIRKIRVSMGYLHPFHPIPWHLARLGLPLLGLAISGLLRLRFWGLGLHFALAKLITTSQGTQKWIDSIDFSIDFNSKVKSSNLFKIWKGQVQFYNVKRFYFSISALSGKEQFPPAAAKQTTITAYHSHHRMPLCLFASLSLPSHQHTHT